MAMVRSVVGFSTVRGSGRYAEEERVDWLKAVILYSESALRARVFIFADGRLSHDYRTEGTLDQIEDEARAEMSEYYEDAMTPFDGLPLSAGIYAKPQW